jgi:hypothetical protein
MWAGRPGIHSRQGQHISVLHSVQTVSGAQPAPYTMGTGVDFRGVRRPGREADYSRPSSAEVKNGATISTLPLPRLHGTGTTLPFRDP